MVENHENVVRAYSTCIAVYQRQKLKLLNLLRDRIHLEPEAAHRMMRLRSHRVKSTMNCHGFMQIIHV